MFLASSVTKLTTPQVMAEMKKYCHEHSGGLGEAIGKLPSEAHGTKVPEQMRDPAKWLTVRGDGSDKDFGQISCFTRTDQTTLGGFVDRLTRFMATGDVSELGDMRYAVARRVTDRSTHVLAIWTQGRFNIADMFPEKGDAPGNDLPEIPRPQESTRLFSADFPGHPYAARIYETHRSRGTCSPSTTSHMRGRGYSAEGVWKERHGEPLTATPSYARAFTKNGVTFIISALTEPAFGDGTQVGIVQMGNSGKIQAVAGAKVLP